MMFTPTTLHLLIAMLSALDALLTGKASASNVRHNVAALVDDAERFVYGHIWYMADGGYGRLCLDLETGDLVLSGPPAKPETTVKWDTDPNVSALRREITATVLAELKRRAINEARGIVEPLELRR